MIGNETNNPLVSILIPVFNVEAFLPQCLDSVLGQTYKNLQVVLIDDGSKDGSLTIMQDYGAKDERIELYHQENQGVGATRNHLLEYVRGEYVLFVDSDDWIEVDMVAFLVGKIQETNTDIAMCNSVINDAIVKNGFVEEVLSKETVIEKFLYHKDLRGSLWNKLIKKSLFHNERFHCGISYGEDALFCWHIFQNVPKVVSTTRELYHYRMNEGSLCYSQFGPKKMSAHYAWEQICEETAKWWPQYLNIAQARHCIEDLLLLRDAARSQYFEIENIKMLQKTIMELRHTLNEVPITSTKMRFYAFIASNSYLLAGKL